MEWRATGPFDNAGSGKSVPSSDPAAFEGSFAPAFASGTFSGSELGFSFKSDPGVNSTLGYAEVGFETNGSYMK
jgi:hypothetical protein